MVGQCHSDCRVSYEAIRPVDLRRAVWRAGALAARLQGQGNLHRGLWPRMAQLLGPDPRHGPASANARVRWRGCLVPGYWQGDLIKGAGHRSSVGTLVEWTSSLRRVLVQPAHAKAETARDGLRRLLPGGAGAAAPDPDLRPGQGDGPLNPCSEPRATAMNDYFAELHAPWQARLERVHGMACCASNWT